MMGPGDWWQPMWGAWGFGMGLGMLLFWGVVLLGLVVAVRALLGPGKASSRDAALEVLRERYARGEISPEEFEARKRDLAA